MPILQIIKRNNVQNLTKHTKGALQIQHSTLSYTVIVPQPPPCALF